LVKLNRPPAAGAAGAAAGVDVASVEVLAAGAAPNEKPEGAAFGAELASVVVDVSAGFPKRGVADVALDNLNLATPPIISVGTTYAGASNEIGALGAEAASAVVVCAACVWAAPAFA
jgi:hypothetical protein